MNLRKLLISALTLISLVACNPRLDSALEQAGENREEMEKVLDHFKNNPDTLKYSAAKFLIENMPYHFTQEGKDMDSADSAYLAMAEYPKEQRQKVFLDLTGKIKNSDNKVAVDIKKIKADYLIKVINEACDLWHEVAWSKEYSSQLFFDYVLPYRLLDEPLSDWKETVKKVFPSLYNNDVLSKRGIQMEFDTLDLKGCSVVDNIGASEGKFVLLKDKGTSVSFNVEVSTDCKKNMTLNYSAIKRNTRLEIKLNNKLIDTLRLDPTNDENTFRLSRFGYDLGLKKGNNKISLSFAGDTIGLDYVQICAIEKCDESKVKDFSRTFCMIKNMQNGYYITFDTLQASLLNKLEVMPLHKNDSAQMVRMDYLGGRCWKISAFKKDTIDLCMEVQYIRTNPGAPMSQYKYINGNNQKWVIIPLENGLSKIMSKDTGLFLDIEKDDKTGKVTIVQNPYSGRKSQQWKIEQKGLNPIAFAQFPFGSTFSEALRVYDVMKQFEWVAMSTGLAPKVSSLFKALTGNCRDEASFTVHLSRSLGLPTTIDFTPHWGNRSWGHQWSVLINPDGTSTPFYMNSVPGDTAQFFHPYLKAKVFRHRFQLNRQITADMQGEKNVPKLFQRPDWIDVTEEYCPTTDVIRNVPQKYKDRRVAYICVFDNNDWLPIYYGIVKDGKVTFPRMGRNLMYIIGFYDNWGLVPFGNPFHVLSDGSVKEIKMDSKHKCTMNLTRKYPFFAEKESFNSRMIGGKFQGANSPDFSNATDLLVFTEETNGNWYERKVANSGKYRYLRYLSPNGSYGNINEICFYDEKGDTIVGEIIGSDGKVTKCKETVFDKNILTGFEGPNPDGNWVGIKLKVPRPVSKLRFIPRTDGNCIEIGDKYELKYWNNGVWKALPAVKAKSDVLTYKNIPRDGLFVLKDLTKGQEQRIFTYEDGKQVWW